MCIDGLLSQVIVVQILDGVTVRLGGQEDGGVFVADGQTGVPLGLILQNLQFLPGVGELRLHHRAQVLLQQVVVAGGVTRAIHGFLRAPELLRINTFITLRIIHHSIKSEKY